MRIKHNISRDGCTLRGQILETIFEENEEREDLKYHYSKDWEFTLQSYYNPELKRSRLYVYGEMKINDKITISYTYNSVEEAKKALDYINEFTVTEADDILAPWTQVYVSDVSIEVAMIRKLERKLIIDLSSKYSSRYIVEQKDNRYCSSWKYAVPVPLPQKTERKVMMTDEEYEAYLSNK